MNFADFFVVIWFCRYSSSLLCQCTDGRFDGTNGFFSNGLERAFILCGYRGVDIWFPIPYADHGRRAQLFREVELTGTKFTSILKAELLILPLSLICGFIFWQLIWSMGPIPSPAFQYAQTYWHLIALRQCLWYSATIGGETLFDTAIKGWWIVGGFLFAEVSLWSCLYFDYQLF